ncbi:unnamed protein product [Ambrosiozyma monospora]|uniref:Unnamed protein product n=1 Tax=Ambrosiozyma monospora TaxID=43982 RepID=A0A9W6T1P8_AMBMO|nr:unnamed protein product [Ambrosiozyma monospora]
MEDESFPEACKEHVERWRQVNDNYNHQLLTLQEAEDNVVEFLKPNVPEVVEALRSLPNDRLKYEFLKYLIVYINGGVYASIDTTDIKPLKFWYTSRLIPDRLMVGVSTDYNDGEWEKLYNRRLSFSTSLFKAKSHHPFLAKLIARITFIIFTQKETIQNTNWDDSFGNVDANGEPLVSFTGANIFTDTLFEYLNNIDNAVYVKVAKPVREQRIHGPEVPENQRFSYKTFTGAIAPTQVDDVLIMPLITFSGYENARKDTYDDDDSRTGYDKYYYGRSLSLTEWSNNKVRIDSS